MQNNEIEYSLLQMFGFNYYPSSKTAEKVDLNESNTKNLVLVSKNRLQTENKEFLEKVLSSIHINSENEYSILCLENPLPWLKIKENFPELQLLLVFGFHPLDLQLQTHNQLNRWLYLGETKLIFTHPIEKLAPDPDLKVKFWDQLKNHANSNS